MFLYACGEQDFGNLEQNYVHSSFFQQYLTLQKANQLENTKVMLHGNKIIWRLATTVIGPEES